MGSSKWILTWSLVAGWAMWVSTAVALPGIYVGKDSQSRIAHTTHMVLLLGPGISVVTIVADYEGPLEPFALLLPVPSDVGLSRLSTIKRRFVSRLEQLSAPRLHTFYEQDPCWKGPVEQQWDERIAAKGRGFLAPPVMPPVDDHYVVSNEISRPIRPVFKGAESEFSYHVLVQPTLSVVRAWLERNGYRVEADPLEGLKRHLSGANLVIAEVRVGRAELLGPRRLQLGGIRYWTRQPVTTIGSTLGRFNGHNEQDLFVYVLHREHRFEAKNYENVILPTNVGVKLEARRRLGAVYNALFDVGRSRTPLAMMQEFVWSTQGCGLPCPNAPLDLGELMSLGADVVEGETVTAAERNRKPPPEMAAEKAKLEQELAGVSPEQARRMRQDHDQIRRELFFRRALAARHVYVLSRLHARYEASSLPRDFEIGPADHAIEGGVGVPVGPAGVLPMDARPAAQSRLQMRFVATRAWSGPVACSDPARWRWGKRWKSLRHVWRAVAIAQNLPSCGRDREALIMALSAPVPAFGLTGASAVPAARAPKPGGSGALRPKGGCSVSHPSVPGRTPAGGLGLLSLVGLSLSRPRARRLRSG